MRSSQHATCPFVCLTPTQANSFGLEGKKGGKKWREKWCVAKNRVYARCSCQLKSTVLQYSNQSPYLSPSPNPSPAM